jgi:hypothetical protein
MPTKLFWQLRQIKHSQDREGETARARPAKKSQPVRRGAGSVRVKKGAGR